MDFCATFRANFFRTVASRRKIRQKGSKEEQIQACPASGWRTSCWIERTQRSPNEFPFPPETKEIFCATRFPTAPHHAASRRLASSHVNPFSPADCHRDQRQADDQGTSLFRGRILHVCRIWHCRIDNAFEATNVMYMRCSRFWDERLFAASDVDELIKGQIELTLYCLPRGRMAGIEETAMDFYAFMRMICRYLENIQSEMLL